MQIIKFMELNQAMMKIKLIVTGGIFLSAILIINLGGCSGTTAGGSGSGAFATGKYRNLFRGIGHTEKEIAQKTNAAFNQSDLPAGN